MKVLVTGAAGCLGTELCIQLAMFGHNVLAVDNMSRYHLLGEDGPRAQQANELALEAAGILLYHDDFQNLTKAQVHSCDAIVHAAAQTCHSRKGVYDNPVQDVRVNINGTVMLLEMAREARLPFLFISSAKVYGERVDHWPQPTSESCPLGDQTHLTFFGASKASADLFAQMYGTKYDFPVGVLRPGCFTGKYALAAEAQNFLGWLVHCALKERQYNVFGDGEQVRDHLDARDLAAACIKWLCAPRCGVWNIGGGPGNAEPLNVSVLRVEALTGKSVCKILREARVGDIRSLVMDSRKFMRDYSWAPRCTLTEIMEELISCVA